MRIGDSVVAVNIIALASISCGEASPAAGWGATMKAAASSSRERLGCDRRVFSGRHTHSCSTLAFLGRRPRTTTTKGAAGPEEESVGALSSAAALEAPDVGGEAAASAGSLVAETAEPG